VTAAADAGGGDGLAAALAEIGGDSQVITDAGVTASYETDWTGRFSGRSRLVVRPGSTAEVAAVMRTCAKARATVVSQGGNTGLVGGGVPVDGELVMSLRRLDDLEPVDRVAAQVTAGAGVTLARLQQHARDAGLDFAVDLTARDSATVGGMVATNAGGVHVMRHGGMRAQVVGVEAVLANGEIVTRLSGLIKDNSGYDLASLFCGSEGTLGIVTRARLRLVPQLSHRVAALVALPSTEAALAVTALLRERVPSLEAVEITFGSGIDLVVEQTELPRPFPVTPPVCLLVECAATRDPTDELAEALAACADVQDTAVASDAAGRERLWSWREHHADAVQRLGVPHKLDVTLPLSTLADFVGDVRAAVAADAPDAVVVIWGHLGDGNLHVNVVGPPPDDEAVDDAVLRLVAARGGSISAEHGIGRAKRAWLHLTRSPADLAAMQAIKHALDPEGILNPNVLFET
jgi:FAD/FMN-containing dehydrogenase